MIAMGPHVSHMLICKLLAGYLFLNLNFMTEFEKGYSAEHTDITFYLLPTGFGNRDFLSFGLN